MQCVLTQRATLFAKHNSMILLIHVEPFEQKPHKNAVNGFYKENVFYSVVFSYEPSLAWVQLSVQGLLWETDVVVMQDILALSWHDPVRVNPSQRSWWSWAMPPLISAKQDCCKASLVEKSMLDSFEFWKGFQGFYTVGQLLNFSKRECSQHRWFDGRGFWCTWAFILNLTHRTFILYK